MHRLTIPIPDQDIRALHVGDTVFLNGIIVTGRDAADELVELAKAEGGVTCCSILLETS